MANALHISAGQYSDKGRKERNQDFHGLCVPPEPQLSAKGIVFAVADGISSSAVSQVASQYAVAGLLEDYYCTSDAWSVKTSVERIVSATNAWLHAQTQQSQFRHDHDRGYVCTLSAMVLKSATAHLFHVGDSRIYRLRGDAIEQLSTDHRVWVGGGQSYLGRALGIKPQLDMDYLAVPLELGDTFVLATDGVYEHVSPHAMVATILAFQGDLERAARALVDAAFQNASADNLTVQMVRVESLPSPQSREMVRQLLDLPFAPLLQPRMVLDGFIIVRALHDSHRSHIYLAQDGDSGTPVVIKIPSIDQPVDAGYVERLLTEEWVARRINSAHVLKACLPTRKRHFIYVVTEYIDGQTLAQWMLDNPRPSLETVRAMVEQIAKGLQAFHRLEMLHQDLRPDNIMIDRSGTVKIIDFGSTQVAGLLEVAPFAERTGVLGTVQYAAPEYFLGERGTPGSDIFSLGVITYHLLTGRLPYGAMVARARTRAAQNRLRYASALDDDREIPAWIDGVLKKAVHPNPAKRYAELSEFVHDLRHPRPEFLSRARAPLLERNPVAFWKGVSLLLALLLVVCVVFLAR